MLTISRSYLKIYKLKILIQKANVLNFYEILFLLIVSESAEFSSSSGFSTNCFEPSLYSQLTGNLISNFSTKRGICLFYRNIMNTISPEYLLLLFFYIENSLPQTHHIMLRTKLRTSKV